jgi:hypothetical protein
MRDSFPRQDYGQVQAPEVRSAEVLSDGRSWSSVAFGRTRLVAELPSGPEGQAHDEEGPPG